MSNTWLSWLNEFIQKSGGKYTMTNGYIQSTGSVHSPSWEIELLVGDHRVVGKSTSIKNARQATAKELMHLLSKSEPDLSREVFLHHVASSHGRTAGEDDDEEAHVRTEDYDFCDFKTHEIVLSSAEIYTIDGAKLEHNPLFKRFLKSNKSFGVDLEGTSARNLPYLVQISGRGQTWLVRLTDARYRTRGINFPSPLLELFSDETKTKFTFGYDNLGRNAKNVVDVQKLTRRSPRFVQQMEEMLGRPRNQMPSLCDVATVLLYNKERERTGGSSAITRFVKDKTITLSNWGAPSLTSDQINYAAMDTHLTLFIGRFHNL